MKHVLSVFAVLLLAVGSLYAQMKLVALKGDVSIRHGVNEQWVTVAKGDVLKPDDSIRLGEKSIATIVTDNNTKLQIPEMTLIDLSDLRMLTQDELLLRLTMERVRTIPDQNRENDFHIPHTTTIHGANKDISPIAIPAMNSTGVMQLNGVKVLYDNGFYATSALKAKKVFRLIPQTAEMIDSRLLVASALEKMNLNGEALTEYLEISKQPLSESQRVIVDGKIALLKKKG
ncbi:MAG: hypothetical protein ACHQQQ_12180 [Bacteroidota bacterium]